MMNKNHEEVKLLLQKYISNTCTEEEKAWVETWYLDLIDREAVYSEEESVEHLDDLKYRLSLITQENKMVIRFPWKYVAASILLFLGITTAVYFIKDSSSIKTSENQIADIAPGSNRAILTINGAEKYDLADSLHLDAISGITASTLDHYKIETPRAGQYEVRLPDGTVAFLNASSSITYPNQFMGSNRVVTITGEVFFDVVKDPMKPFIVRTDQMDIEVLGTSFNINTFSNTATTLVEGSVRAINRSNNQSKLIKPGQQIAMNSSNDMVVREVSVDDYVSWKDGIYTISNKTLAEFAEQLERWYDIEVDMGNYGDKRISAIIPRDVKLSEVLEAIELKTNIKFKTNERRVFAIDIN